MSIAVLGGAWPRVQLRLHAFMAIVAATTCWHAAAQNLIGNGSFEAMPEAPPRIDCCAELGTVGAGSDAIAPWTVSGAGVELRGRSIECPAGGANGQRWIRLGTGTAGGSVEQSFPTEAGRRYICRFRRWVQASPGPTVPIQVVGPGFSVFMHLPSDGPVCEPAVAGTSSVQFDAIAGDSSIRFAYGGGPAMWNVSIDEVVIVPVEDCDGDGIVDGLAIQDGVAEDADDNGIPDTCDCLGDANGDRRVDGFELSMLLGNWNGAIPAALDFDGNGIAGGADLAALLGAWGPCR